MSPLYRYGCMIQDGHNGVLTGGKSSGAVTNKVTRYNRTGMQEPLPRLINQRSGHGCSSLVMDRKKVNSSINFFVSKLCYTAPCPGLPGGGWNGWGGMGQLPLQHGAAHCRRGRLEAVWGRAAACRCVWPARHNCGQHSLHFRYKYRDILWRRDGSNYNLYMLGGRDRGTNYRKDIWKYNAGNATWETDALVLATATNHHSMSSIEHCPG